MYAAAHTDANARARARDKGITLRVTYTSAHNTRYLHYLAKRRGPVLVTPLRIKAESRAIAIARLNHRLWGKIGAQGVAQPLLSS